MAPKRKQESVATPPSKRLKIDTEKENLTPPSFEGLDATLDALSRMMRNKPLDERRRCVIDEQRRTSARSVACGQQFPRSCQQCKAESPLRRAVCSYGCGIILCSSCADNEQMNQCCSSPGEYIQLFEDESRECLVCMEIPFSRTAFSACGHIICTACSIQLLMNVHNQGLPLCPFCRVPSYYAPLVENLFNPPEAPKDDQTSVDNSKIPSFFIARLLGNLEELSSKQQSP